MRGLHHTSKILAAACALFHPSRQKCTQDQDCSLINGVCSRNHACRCDAGWIGDDCGILDVRPAKRDNGYNQTARGTSSWCNSIVKDPQEDNLYHLFVSEFSHGCGLDYWAPYSRIIRAESRSGPAGPYESAAPVQGTFAHNPTVVYSPADGEWLMYRIGCPTEVADTCQVKRFTCGAGNTNNGESGITVMTSRDLRNWKSQGQVLRGNNGSGWDADVTNPSAFPLFSRTSRGDQGDLIADTRAVLLAYRGCPYNCAGEELINVAVSEAGYAGPYEKLQQDPVFASGNEDPFIWRDSRGTYHMLLHSLEPGGGFGDGPRVGRHAWARDYQGPWTLGNRTLAFSTEIKYDDGTVIDFHRRERPQLYFSEDGTMTPLFLGTGVQPKGSAMSYSVIVPVGDAGVDAQRASRR
ncbi:Glycosyl hydrolase family 43, five-bladed beta-propellor domain protein [Metarhizium album ARSEF 1941]|uniref:Glycosyl hydrolase family 43, five-bladed beta-propellor domain protein n=1 Tax=Metarhizium album (strain ARSEF 1941) TaxID=1081103 RepID=A0A0B2X478_METAS|nr:Glycosyl hydrolase family 43, five-bladed beta-propellor domain protein [Metarhizium album ARSEF 1941]KHO00563.1 Glycosyl hydrolase family 43, five-bladed beta-propellor domain protein [Metarhizium album ARSEF 1941]